MRWIAFVAAVCVMRLSAQVTVPLVGCNSDGQAGPADAPAGQAVSVAITPKAADQLAYYTALGLGALGPRGWHCFGVYGSGGASLFLSPDPIHRRDWFRDDQKLTGPAIQISWSYGGTSGRDVVAKVIARVFPA